MRRWTLSFDLNYPLLLESKSSDLLVAEQNAIVAGYVLASDSLTLFANGIVAELLELYVMGSERRRGVGRILVQSAVDRALAQRCARGYSPRLRRAVTVLFEARVSYRQRSSSG